MQEAVERSRREEGSRKELMAGLSHDLRTPLTSIQAYVEGLLAGVVKTPEVQHRYLTTIKSRAEELEGMVCRILTYSRLEFNNALHMGGTVRAENGPQGGLRIIMELPKGEDADAEDPDR